VFGTLVRSGEFEPTYENGDSILHYWLDHSVPNLYVCKVPVRCRPCNVSHHKQNGALAHVRAHLTSRSYECNGKCGTFGCQDTFATPADLVAHIDPVLQLRLSIATLLSNLGLHPDSAVKYAPRTKASVISARSPTFNSRLRLVGFWSSFCLLFVLLLYFKLSTRFHMPQTVIPKHV